MSTSQCQSVNVSVSDSVSVSASVGVSVSVSVRVKASQPVSVRHCQSASHPELSSLGTSIGNGFAMICIWKSLTIDVEQLFPIIVILNGFQYGILDL